MKLTVGDIKDLNLLKHYRIVRKWACKNNGFIAGSYSYSWDSRRWNRLLQEGWIQVWRSRNRTTQKYNIYKVSFKCKQLIIRIYKIILGEEDIPISTRRNKIMKGQTYTDKVLKTSIDNVNKDKNR